MVSCNGVAVWRQNSLHLRPAAISLYSMPGSLIENAPQGNDVGCHWPKENASLQGPIPGSPADEVISSRIVHASRVTPSRRNPVNGRHRRHAKMLRGSRCRFGSHHMSIAVSLTFCLFLCLFACFRSVSEWSPPPLANPPANRPEGKPQKNGNKRLY